jgi:hypothetical protein
MRGLRVALLCGSLAILTQAVPAQRSATRSPDAAIVASLMESIRGREHLPAAEVFQNVRILREVPAGDLLTIMHERFGPALNVRCIHCHVPEDWSADEIRAKQTAREMLLMVRNINEQLARMKHLDDEMAVVRCSTCHRGELRPGGLYQRSRR